MPIDKLVNLVATVTLIEMMITIGLGVPLADVAAVFRNAPLLLRAALGNYVIVPAIAVGLLFAFHVQPIVAVGFLIAAVCPGAPYGPRLTAAARGNVVTSVGLMVLLAASSALVAPLLLRFLLPLVTGDASLRVNVPRMLVSLLITQILPLSVGLFIRHRAPARAERLESVGARLSTLLNVLMLALIVVAQWSMLVSIRPRGWFGMLLLVAATFTAGALLGGRRSSDRKTLAMSTSVRNAGLALVIAAGSFPNTLAVPATIAYALFQTISVAIAAILWGRMTPAPQPVPAPAAPPAAATPLQPAGRDLHVSSH